MQALVERGHAPSQCTFWCSVLSDRRHRSYLDGRFCLNAPFGAQCFPTLKCSPSLRTSSFCLNAPFGAQCFPTMELSVDASIRNLVSMHLLVLSAFRRGMSHTDGPSSNVSMHLLVLSAFRRGRAATRPFRLSTRLNAPFGAQCFPTYWNADFLVVEPRSQCTFWCSVLSDTKRCDVVEGWNGSLNAPFGAQCFPTLSFSPRAAMPWPVSMHLLVLSAFRPESGFRERLTDQVSMHLLVLSAFRLGFVVLGTNICLRLNAPFGAQCFPTADEGICIGAGARVSMHLLVLSAFRRAILTTVTVLLSRLNAPFGAQCFPTSAASPEIPDTPSQCTFWCSVLSDNFLIPARRGCGMGLNAPFGAQCFPTLGTNICLRTGIWRLNAPFGAQCFPTQKTCDQKLWRLRVSMHLLVLSAFRHGQVQLWKRIPFVSMHLLVLSAFRQSI